MPNTLQWALCQFDNLLFKGYSIKGNQPKKYFPQNISFELLNHLVLNSGRNISTYNTQTHNFKPWQRQTKQQKRQATTVKN